MRIQDPGRCKPAAVKNLSLALVILMSLLLLQACGGKSAEADSSEAAPSGGFSYMNFENGGLNPETGGISGGDTALLRSLDFLAVSDLITAQVGMEYWIQYFAYDSSHQFLGASNQENVILSSTILEDFPGCAYIKLVIGSGDGTQLDPALLDTYGMILRLRSEYKARETARSEITDISGEYSGTDLRSLTAFLDNDSGSDRPQILSCVSRYQSAGASYPSIQFSLLDPEGKEQYLSPLYRLGEAGEESTENQWRLPPYQGTDDQIKILIIIPADVVLTIDSMQVQEDTLSAAKDPVLYTAYQGFSGLYPPSTVPAFWMAGEMKYQSCVVVPQLTSDNVWVCFQDTATVRNLLRYPDGCEIEAGGPDDRPVSRFTYEELMQLDAGMKTSPHYSGKKVASLDQFFDICSQYGMTPVLSIPSDADYMRGTARARFSSIRDLAEQYGVLGQLRIKASDRDVLRAAEAVFGHDIAGYIVVRPQNADWDPLDFMKTAGFVDRSAEGMQESGYSVVIEFPAYAVTPEMIQNAIVEGFPVAIEAPGTGLTGPVMERLIDLGVTEFTTSNHCSMGLNW